MDKPSFKLNETDTFIFRNGETTKLKKFGYAYYSLQGNCLTYSDDRIKDGIFYAFFDNIHPEDIVGVKKMVDYSKPIFIGDDEVKVLWQDEKIVLGVISERYVMIDKDDDGYQMIELDDCYNGPVRNKNLRWLVFDNAGSICGNYKDKDTAVEAVKYASYRLRIMKIDISDESSYE